MDRDPAEPHPAEPHPVEAPDGAAFRSVAHGSKRAPAVFAIASVVLLAVAVLARILEPAADLSAVDLTPDRPTTEVATRAPQPALVPDPSAPSGPPSRNPAATPHPSAVVAAVPVEPGANAFVPAGRSPVRLTIALDGGWKRIDDATFSYATGVARAGITVGAWSLMHVNVFPCRWSTDVFAAPELMQTAAGQAQALASWWGQDPGMPPNSNSPIAPLASTPRPTTFAGYPAWYVEVLIPTDLDLAECDGAQLVLWHTLDGDTRISLGRGERIRLWVVDVEGAPIVVEGSTFLAGSIDYDTRLGIVLDSVVIERGVG